MCWSHSDGVRDPRSNRVVTAPVRLSPHTDKSISRIRFIGHERDKVSEKSALSEARRHKRLLIFGWFNGTDYRLAWIGHTPKYRDITDSHHIFSTLYLYFFIFPFCFFFFIFSCLCWFYDWFWKIVSSIFFLIMDDENITRWLKINKWV